MQISHGKGKSIYGPGVSITLSGNELAKAIDAYLLAHGYEVSGPRTITVNGEMCDRAEVYVDSAGSAKDPAGKRWSGRGDGLNGMTGEDVAFLGTVTAYLATEAEPFYSKVSARHRIQSQNGCVENSNRGDFCHACAQKRLVKFNQANPAYQGSVGVTESTADRPLKCSDCDAPLDTVLSTFGVAMNLGKYEAMVDLGLSDPKTCASSAYFLLRLFTSADLANTARAHRYTDTAYATVVPRLLALAKRINAYAQEQAKNRPASSW